MNTDYNVKAANWWATKIKEAEEEAYIYGLESFKNSLAYQIKKLTSLNGYMVISTYNTSSSLLNELANYSGLSTRIPSGYEMKIFIDNVFVYNSEGLLVTKF